MWSTRAVVTTFVLTVAVLLLQHATTVSSAPLYAREARNTKNESECTYFFTDGWASCCEIQLNMTKINTTTNETVDTTTETNATTTTNTTTTKTTTTVTSGVYKLDHYGPFSATYGYCDLEVDGGGWLVIFRNINGTDFQRGLKDYEDGFGSLEEGNSFWYGLKVLSHLANRGVWELRIDLINSKQEEPHTVHAHYTNFSIGDRSEGYKLQLGPYVEDKSSASDSLHEFNGNMFYTVDNDGPMSTGCAEPAGGGWWYTKHCGGQRGGILTAKHNHLRGWYSLSEEETIAYERTEMKIRQVTCAL